MFIITAKCSKRRVVKILLIFALLLSLFLALRACRHSSPPPVIAAGTNSIRKFDVIFALRRTARYLFGHKDEHLTKIAGIISNREMIKNYLDSLDTCMVGTDIGSVLNKIDSAYPGLNAGIRDIMRQYRQKDDSIGAKCRLFLISPNLYMTALLLKHRIEPGKAGKKK